MKPAAISPGGGTWSSYNPASRIWGPEGRLQVPSALQNRNQRQQKIKQIVANFQSESRFILVLGISNPPLASWTFWFFSLKTTITGRWEFWAHKPQGSQGVTSGSVTSNYFSARGNKYSNAPKSGQRLWINVLPWPLCLSVSVKKNGI